MLRHREGRAADEWPGESERVMPCCDEPAAEAQDTACRQRRDGPIGQAFDELAVAPAPRDYVYSPIFLPWQEEPPVFHADELSELIQQTRLAADREKFLFRLMNFNKYRADLVARRAVRQVPGTALSCAAATYLHEAQLIRNALVLLFLRLVNSVVMHYRRGDWPLDELLSEGSWVLIRAVEKFDADRGFRFSTYATHALHRHLKRQMHITMRSICRSQLPKQLPEQEDHRRHEREALRQDRALQIVQTAICDLPPREATIVRLRFGFNNDGQRHTLNHVADRLNLSRERVRQLEQGAIETLRTRTARQLDELYA